MRTHRGPNLFALAVVFVALFVASIVLNVMLIRKGVPFPTPYMPVEAAQAYYARFANTVRLISFLQFGAAIPLGLFTATIASRMRFLRVNVAGVDIAQFGGYGASLLLAISALSTWALSQPGVADQASALRVLQLTGFATGGFGHVATFGLLLAGISVPGLILRLIPRWLGWLGVILAAICELSTLSMIFPALSPLLPIGRFPAFIWLIGVGLTLPKSTLTDAGVAAVRPSETWLADWGT